MFINTNYKTGMEINIGDTFTYGSDADSATIVDIEGDTMHVVWDEGCYDNVGWKSCSITEFMETMEFVYGKK